MSIPSHPHRRPKHELSRDARRAIKTRSARAKKARKAAQRRRIQRPSSLASSLSFKGMPHEARLLLRHSRQGTGQETSPSDEHSLLGSLD